MARTHRPPLLDRQDEKPHRRPPAVVIRDLVSNGSQGLDELERFGDTLVPSGLPRLAVHSKTALHAAELTLDNEGHVASLDALSST